MRAARTTGCGPGTARVARTARGSGCGDDVPDVGDPDSLQRSDGRGRGRHGGGPGRCTDRLGDAHRLRLGLERRQRLADLTQDVGQPDAERPADAREQLGGGLLLAPLDLGEVAQADPGGRADLAQRPVLAQPRRCAGPPRSRCGAPPRHPPPTLVTVGSPYPCPRSRYAPAATVAPGRSPRTSTRRARRSRRARAAAGPGRAVTASSRTRSRSPGSRALRTVVPPGRRPPRGRCRPACPPARPDRPRRSSRPPQSAPSRARAPSAQRARGLLRDGAVLGEHRRGHAGHARPWRRSRTPPARRGRSPRPGHSVQRRADAARRSATRRVASVWPRSRSSRTTTAGQGLVVLPEDGVAEHGRAGLDERLEHGRVADRW